MLKLFYFKLKYYFLKYCYFLISFNIIRKILKLFYLLFDYLLLLFYVIEEDFYFFKLKIHSFKEFYFNLRFLKHLFLLFLLITGVIPLFIFIYFIFFSLKYFFKYLFITLDYWFPHLDNFIYKNLKKFINGFFYWIPYLLFKLYKYLFGGGWLKFFWQGFLNYLKIKWSKFLNFFFTITDEFLLISLPKKYTQLSEKLSDFYYWSLINFFKLRRIIPNFFKKIRKKIRKKFYGIYRIYWKIKIKCRRFKRIYDYWRRKYYYLWYFRYIRSYIYYAWIFKKYIWSDIFNVTLEAFFFIAYWDFIACIKYSLALFYTRIQYIYCKIFYGLWIRWALLEFPLNKLKENIYYKLRGLKVDLKLLFLELIRGFISNSTLLVAQLIYYDPNNWYWWEHECYEVDKGYISIMWRSYKFYAVIQKFFRRLYPTPLKLFFYNKKFYQTIYRTIYEYLIIIIFRRFVEGCYFMFYLKFIYHI